MKLFAIVIGGLAKGSIVEVHDVRFAVAERIEETYEELRKTWWGIPRTLHLDCYGELTATSEGYTVALGPDKPAHAEKLYFVNLGGYDPAEFAEAHLNLFVAALNEAEAKQKALGLAKGRWPKAHKDFVYDVDQAFCINDVALGRDLYIHLTKPDVPPQPFAYVQGYFPIGR